MDQIGDGSTISDAEGSTIWTGTPQYNTAVVDDFITTSAVQLSEVDVLGENYDGNIPGASTIGLEVNIYSSLAAAASNLTGNIGSIYVAKSGFTVDTSFVPPNHVTSTPVLISIPISLSLPSAGTYFVGVSVVVADSAIEDGPELFGVLMEPTATVDNPGGENAFFINPSKAYIPGTNGTLPLYEDAAYRIIDTAVVPEPATYAAFAGIAALGFVALRRRKA
jgi:hypothetical protein